MHRIRREALGMQVQSWWQSCQLSFAKRRKKRVTTCGKSEWRETTPKLWVPEVRGFNMARGRRTPVEWQRCRCDFFFFLKKGKKYWLMSQFCPDHPRKQSQWYPPIKFLQERAFTQGFRAHSFLSVKAGCRRRPSPSIETNQGEDTQRKNRHQKLNLWSRR